MDKTESVELCGKKYVAFGFGVSGDGNPIGVSVETYPVKSRLLLALQELEDGKRDLAVEQLHDAMREINIAERLQMVPHLCHAPEDQHGPTEFQLNQPA